MNKVENEFIQWQWKHNKTLKSRCYNEGWTFAATAVMSRMKGKKKKSRTRRSRQQWAAVKILLLLFFGNSNTVVIQLHLTSWSQYEWPHPRTRIFDSAHSHCWFLCKSFCGRQNNALFLVYWQYIKMFLVFFCYFIVLWRCSAGIQGGKTNNPENK